MASDFKVSEEVLVDYNPMTTSFNPVDDVFVPWAKYIFVPARYEVQAGDTLSSLAWNFGLEVSRLAEYNVIANPDQIHVGQVLRIPSY